MRALLAALVLAIASGCGEESEPAPDPCVGKCYVKPGTNACSDGTLGTNGRCVLAPTASGITSCVYEYDCPASVQCRSAADCKAGQYCDAPVGCDSVGTCRWGGDSRCDLSHPPVCGCDGKTYFNACLARQAGTKAAREGECVAASTIRCGAATGATCPDGTFCRLPDEACSASETTGYCMTRPTDCPDIYSPVCGCDGKSYKNVCLAWAAGQNFSEWANCPAK